MFNRAHLPLFQFPLGNVHLSFRVCAYVLSAIHHLIIFCCDCSLSHSFFALIWSLFYVRACKPFSRYDRACPNINLSNDSVSCYTIYRPYLLPLHCRSLLLYLYNLRELVLGDNQFGSTSQTIAAYVMIGLIIAVYKWNKWINILFHSTEISHKWI